MSSHDSTLDYRVSGAGRDRLFTLDTSWNDIHELYSYEKCLPRNGYTTPPASIAVVEWQRAREGGVSFTGHTTEPIWHHTKGPLMKVGAGSLSFSIIEIPPLERLMPGAQWVYLAASGHRHCGVASSARGWIRPQRQLSRTDIALHYGVTDEGRDIICLFLRILGTWWGVMYELYSYVRVMPSAH